jgi:dihydrofolate reductase
VFFFVSFVFFVVHRMRVSIIAAVAQNGVIGRDGKLPWHLSADLQRFKRLTMGHTIIMGRRTWESIGRPLPGRRMVVVTRQPNYKINFPDVVTANTLDDALKIAKAACDVEAFIVGGAQLYDEALHRADRLYLTRVLTQVEGDTYFPRYDASQWMQTSAECHSADTKNEFPFRFECYERQ